MKTNVTNIITISDNIYIIIFDTVLFTKTRKFIKLQIMCKNIRTYHTSGFM